MLTQKILSRRMLLIFHNIFLLFAVALSSPPEDPIKCSSHNSDCTITNSYGAFPDRSICRVADVAYPETEQDLMKVVADGTKTQRQMKVATRFSHSIPKLVCPDGDDGFLISTKNMNKVLRIDKVASTMTVQSGVTLEQLINEAAKAGLALPYAPYWFGLTIGGLLSTGAHGSSLWGKGSAVHEYVVGMRIVSPGSLEDGYVTVRALDESNEDHLNAAKVSLGILGVISQVTLKLEPLFKRAITYKTRSDSDLGEQAEKFGLLHEFADFTWYPSKGKVLYRIDDRVPNNVSGNGQYDFIGFQAVPTSALALVRTTEESLEAIGDANGKCVNALLTNTLLKTGQFGLTNNGVIFTGYPVVGYQNRLQSSGSCLHSLEDALITACPWDSRIKGQFFLQTTFTISLSKVKAFIQDVQKLVALVPISMCGPELYNGILMRYIKASSAYLGVQEDSIDFDITYYRSKDPLNPRIFEDVLEEIEQMALFKYNGLPHWGKNRNVAFDGVINKYNQAAEFIKLRETYDPSGLFSNDWTDQILGLKGGPNIVKDGCALEGLCICTQDTHCAPKKGYFCRPGRIYEEARVCRKIS